MIGNAVLLWLFHDRFWYAPDEGIYAHVAQRLLAGEVLNLQVQDVHPGYLSFLHAGAFAVFGVDLLSLRYPLMLAGLIQAALVFRLLAANVAAALVGSLAVTALGVLCFLNPTANWYCLSLLVALACALAGPRGPLRLVLIGVLLGLVGLFRQLSGAFAGVGVLACLLLEESEPRPWRQVWLGRALLVAAALGLGVHLLRTADLGGWLLFGLAPLLVLAWIARSAVVANRRVLQMLGWLAVGVAAAALPLAAYHLATGSTRAWLGDVAGGGLALTRLPFRRHWMYAPFALSALGGLISGSLRGTLDGAYWLALLLAAAGNALLVLDALRKRAAVPPLSLLAVFYALVSLYYQIPIYLQYTAGLSLVSLLLAPGRPRLRRILAALLVGLVAAALLFHAGQPLDGTPSTPVSAQPLPRVHLRIEPGERQRYLDLLAVIERETRPGEEIFALPNQPEVYFLSGRRNPFRFFNTALGITGDNDLRRAEAALEERPPRLVIYNPTDKYGTIYSQRLMQTIRTRYTSLPAIGAFEIYRVR